MAYKTIIEPFRVHTVQAIDLPDRDAREAALVRARAARRDPAWLADYRATRPKVERRIAQLVRRHHGGRRARVRGRPKVAADFALLAAAVNLARERNLLMSVRGIGHNIAGNSIIDAGLMIDRDKIKVLEFNGRFGDPEAQPVLMRMTSDLAPLLVAAADGKLADTPPVEWDPRPAVCVVMDATAALFSSATRFLPKIARRACRSDCESNRYEPSVAPSRSTRATPLGESVSRQTVSSLPASKLSATARMRVSIGSDSAVSPYG